MLALTEILWQNISFVLTWMNLRKKNLSRLFPIHRRYKARPSQRPSMHLMNKNKTQYIKKKLLYRLSQSVYS